MAAMSNMMVECMRWFGPDDPATLSEIRQTGATAVYTALHEIPYGEAWPAEAIARRRELIERHELRWAVAESVPVSEAIKTRAGDYRRHIENYKVTVRRLGEAGVGAVVYNFMPALDWVRTDLRYKLPDGAEALLYDPVKFAAFDLFALARPGAERDFTDEQLREARNYWNSLDDAGRAAFTRQTLDLFPGVRLNVSLDDLRAMLARYEGIHAARLKDNLSLFLKEVAPVAEAAGIRLAIHPDDPPFSVLGLARIVSTERDMADVVSMADELSNGLCYCTGSLGARLDNNLPAIARRLGPRIHAVHLRNVEHRAKGVFLEATHLGGHVDMYAVVRALLDEQRARAEFGRSDWQLTFRPDHGHRILDDFVRPEPVCPGYPLIGRLRGLSELRGLQFGVNRTMEAS